MGEAGNPGPTFDIISANVTSFLPHLDYLATLDGDVVAMQEVRLTADAMTIANDLLTPYSFGAVWGKPQPIRQGTVHSTLDAKQGGVGTLIAKLHSAAPSPRTNLGQQLYDTGRWHSLAIKICRSSLIVHVVSLYGFPRANEGGDEMVQNEELLSNTFAEATSLGNVPVVVMGDFNVTPERSPVLAALITNGSWTDIGACFATLNGTDPEHTYHARGVSSRIDLAFGNREFMQLVKDFQVLDVPATGIRSHKPIRVTIDADCPRSYALEARKVRSFPPSNSTMSTDDLLALQEDVLDRYMRCFDLACDDEDINKMWDCWTHMAETFLAERAAMETGIEGCATNPAFRGRGHAAAVSRVRLRVHGRQFDGAEIHPERCALRKVLNLVIELIQILETGVESHIQSLWDKIKRLSTEVLKFHKSKVLWSFTLAPEKYVLEEIKGIIETEIAQTVIGGRERLIRRWKRDRNERARTNTSDLFRHFRPLEQSPLCILKKDDGTVTGDVEEMDSILRSKWLPIFAKHADPGKPAPRVEPFMERFGHLIEPYPQVLPPFTTQEIIDLVAKLPSAGAGGLDGWKPSEIKRLTPGFLKLLLELFKTIEKTGKWPDELCWASISLIPKGEGGDPLELRPITVTPIIYRLWAALRTRHSMAWQEKWIHKGQHGARAFHSTTDAIARISMEFESAVLDGRNVQGIAVDLSKAFDNVPTGITFAVLEKIGMDDKLLRSLQGMYAQVQRRFKLGRFVGEAFRSTNGILQGCPISVMLLNALMMVMHRAFDEDVIAESYVDDLTLLSSSTPPLQKAMDTVADFMGLTEQKVNQKKTKCFALQSPPNVSYLGSILGEAASVKILGVTWAFERGSLLLRLADKTVEEMCNLAHRIRCSGLPFHLRALLCGSLILPKVLYGCEVVDISASQERALRTAIVNAVWGKADRARNPGLIFTLPIKGHVNDPSQAPFVRRLNSLQRLIKIDPGILQKVQHIWSAKKRCRRMRHGGFVENLLYSAKRLEVSDCIVDDKWCLQLLEEPREPRSTQKKVWAHEVREAARRTIWRGLEKERARNRDGVRWGIGDGVDVAATMKLYHTVDSKKKGILRKILTGGIWTRARLSHLPDPLCSDQCPCGEGREDLLHLWWKCPLWTAAREKFYNYTDEFDMESLPPVTKELGIITQNASKDLDWVQKLMVQVFIARYSTLDSLGPS